MKFVRRRVAMVASTVGTGIFANMITGDQYLSIILTSSLYKKLYHERGYESKLLILFNLLSPLVSIFIAAIGYKIVRKK